MFHNYQQKKNILPAGDFTEKVVFEAIMQMKMNKVSGPDGSLLSSIRDLGTIEKMI
jgi:hypothetical protein